MQKLHIFACHKANTKLSRIFKGPCISRGKFSVQICLPSQFDENLKEKSSKLHPNVGWPIVTNMRGQISVQICIPPQFDENLEEKSSKKHPNVGWPIVTNMRGKFSVQICITSQFDENMEDKSSNRRPNTFDGQLSRISRGQIS
jgi:hypothetical protein